MEIYSIDDDRSSREFIRLLFTKAGDNVHSFSNPFEMYLALQEAIPDVVIVDYDFRAYRLPRGAFECLGKLDCKIILVSGHDWSFICQDLDRRNIDLPKNLEFIQKGSLNMMNRLTGMTKERVLA